MHRSLRTTGLFSLVLAICLGAPAARAQCPEEPRLDSFVGGGRVSCPCFVEGEEAGAIFHLPPEEFPIEILRVGIGWGSQFGGTGQQVEDSIRIYPAGLPDPGTPVFRLDGPQLTDGAINEFDLEPFAGEILLSSSPFTVTLRFLNTNANNIFAPSTVHDGTTCQSNRNVVFAIPGGWTDGCNLGISGQWVFYVVYRQVECGAGGAVPDGHLVLGTPLLLDRLEGDDVELTWSASCDPADDDYEVYAGTLGTFYSHQSLLCTTGGATTATISPGVGSEYYVVVPSNAAGEGSYGRDGTGAERPQGDPSCATQQPVTCP